MWCVGRGAETIAIKGSPGGGLTFRPPRSAQTDAATVSWFVLVSRSPRAADMCSRGSEDCAGWPNGCGR
jgi:hypothetical protein